MDVILFEDKTIEDFRKGKELESYLYDIIDNYDMADAMEDYSRIREYGEIDDDFDEEEQNIARN